MPLGPAVNTPNIFDLTQDLTHKQPRQDLDAKELRT